jgi:ribosome biogenesis GTPase A
MGMVNYWKLVNEVIEDADIILLVLDARLPEETRNREIEQKMRQMNKKILYVLNKCDLVTKEAINKIKPDFNPCVFVSSKQKYGGTILFKKIMEMSKGEKCIVGVLGYPNVGKSSVINLLKGQKSASVSPHSGHTRNKQIISSKGKIKLIDTPGVLPFHEDDLLKKVIIGAYNPEHLREPDFYAMKLVETHPEMFEKYFDMKYETDAYTFLEKAALKKQILIKGGEPDMVRVSRQLLYDWQRGKVHEINLQK